MFQLEFFPVGDYRDDWVANGATNTTLDDAVGHYLLNVLEKINKDCPIPLSRVVNLKTGHIELDNSQLQEFAETRLLTNPPALTQEEVRKFLSKTDAKTFIEALIKVDGREKVRGYLQEAKRRSAEQTHPGVISQGNKDDAI